MVSLTRTQPDLMWVRRMSMTVAVILLALALLRIYATLTITY